MEDAPNAGASWATQPECIGILEEDFRFRDTLHLPSIKAGSETGYKTNNAERRLND
jgi:hypothetical protein